MCVGSGGLVYTVLSGRWKCRSWVCCLANFKPPNKHFLAVYFSMERKALALRRFPQTSPPQLSILTHCCSDSKNVPLQKTLTFHILQFWQLETNWIWTKIIYNSYLNSKYINKLQNYIRKSKSTVIYIIIQVKCVSPDHNKDITVVSKNVFYATT